MGCGVLVLHCRHGQTARVPRCGVDSWLEREIASCRFDDVRHGKRLGVLLEQLSERIGSSIPFACQGWAATKAAYRFFSNARISEDKILAEHFYVPESGSRPFASLVAKRTKRSAWLASSAHDPRAVPDITRCVAC
jgi:hypothetical protein